MARGSHAIPGLAVVALLLCGAGTADAAERTLYEAPADGCTLAVTAEARWHGIRLRRRPAGSECRLGLAEVAAALRRAFAIPAEGGRYTSLFLGRIEYLDWISKHLVARAQADDAWDAVAGRPANGAPRWKIVDFVTRVLNEPDAAGTLAAAAAAGGYTITGVSCEKIIVSGPGTVHWQPRWVPTGKRVPYDALCWLKLE